MPARKLEQWEQLCELAAREQDPQKLMALINAINRVLAEKEQSFELERQRSHRKADR